MKVSWKGNVEPFVRAALCSERELRRGDLLKLPTCSGLAAAAS